MNPHDMDVDDEDEVPPRQRGTEEQHLPPFRHGMRLPHQREESGSSGGDIDQAYAEARISETAIYAPPARSLLTLSPPMINSPVSSASSPLVLDIPRPVDHDPFPELEDGQVSDNLEEDVDEANEVRDTYYEGW